MWSEDQLLFFLGNGEGERRDTECPGAPVVPGKTAWCLLAGEAVSESKESGRVK